MLDHKPPSICRDAAKQTGSSRGIAHILIDHLFAQKPRLQPRRPLLVTDGWDRFVVGV